ncbi:heparinase II/III family protein [Deinococcus sp. RM]|uniref:heparinase II/III family protein n=1 Tax=Deinococcus sp. RM TaxID=2316359 RepID=UPI0011C21001|nr:alginate lyase family protein [Deinococcus sp. RM]
MRDKIGWYLNRLAKMSSAEIMGRIDYQIQIQKWSRQKKWKSPSPLLIDFTKISVDYKSLKLHSALIAEAENYIKREYCLLNIRSAFDNNFWHYDPQSGKIAPLSFGPTINYRDPAIVGSAKNIWEKSRHHHLTVLAAAYIVTQDERYASEVEWQLLSWIEANPIARGLNWTSPLEWGIRLISWTYVERFLRGSPVHARLFGPQGTLWNSMYWSAWMTSQQSSHGSSANNHLIGEMAGLFINAAALPVFPEAAKWEAQARAVLEREVHAQTFESGLNREQAFSYHIFSLEFFLLAGIEAERIGKPFSDEYKARVLDMLEAIPKVMDFSGNLPKYGDSDDAFALQIRSRHSSKTGWLFNLGRIWLGANVPAESGEAELTAYLAWPEKYKDSHSIFISPASSVAFEDAGVYVLASERGTRDEILCFADAGPLGFLSIAAHGHQDALAFTLNIGGVPVIVDPGTYVYHSDVEKRDYFRSTKAHNTIEIDDQPQSIPAGIFMYKTKAISKVTTWEIKDQGAHLKAFHDGYRRLDGRVTHSRDFLLQGKNLIIRDDLSGAGNHLIAWRLHFGPWCDVEVSDGICKVTWPNSSSGQSSGTLKMKLSADLEWTLVRGAPEGGWYSRGFNLLEESTTLVGKAQLTLPYTCEHRLEISHEN